MKKGIAFSGGGMAAHSHVGAYARYYETFGNTFKYLAGTSAGSIIAAAVSMGATPDWISKKLTSTDFSVFRDSSWNPIDNAMRIVHEYGWYRGKTFEDWIYDFIEELTGDRNITFQKTFDRYGTTLIITKVEVLVPRAKLEVLNPANTPDLEVAKAIRSSCSFPYVFVAEKEFNRLFIDGGVLLNYPVKLLLDYTTPADVLGLKLVHANETHNYVLETSRPPKDHMEFIMSIVSSVRDAASMKDEYPEITLCLPSNLGTTDFNASPKQMEADYKNGYEAMDFYIKTKK